MLQLIEEEIVKYSEVLKKLYFKRSLTYWKLKNKELQNIDNLLKSSRFREYTAY